LPERNLEKDDGGQDSNKDCVDDYIDDGEDGDVVDDDHHESVEGIEKQKGHAKSKKEEPRRRKEKRRKTALKRSPITQRKNVHYAKKRSFILIATCMNCM